MQCKCGHGILDHGFINPHCSHCDCIGFRLLEPGDTPPPCQCPECLKQTED